MTLFAFSFSSSLRRLASKIIEKAGISEAVGKLAALFKGAPSSPGRLIGISDRDAGAFGKALKEIEIDGKPAIETVEAFGSRAGSTYRGRPPLPDSDLDIYVTVRSDVANSPAKLQEVSKAVNDIGDLFSGVKKIKINPIIEIDTVASAHKLQLEKTPFIRIDEEVMHND